MPRFRPDFFEPILVHHNTFTVVQLARRMVSWMDIDFSTLSVDQLSQLHASMMSMGPRIHVHLAGGAPKLLRETSIKILIRLALAIAPYDRRKTEQLAELAADGMMVARSVNAADTNGLQENDFFAICLHFKSQGFGSRASFDSYNAFCERITKLLGFSREQEANLKADGSCLLSADVAMKMAGLGRR